MEWYASCRRHALEFRLRSCCGALPLRAGVLLVGYFNALLSVVLVVGTASDSFVPTLSHVQAALMEEASPATCVLPPAAELAASVLLLCAAHRKDLVLLRAYACYGAVAGVVALLVYGVLLPSISALYICAIVGSLVYQVYVVMLVLSLIVELKLQKSDSKDVGVDAGPAPDAEAPREPDVKPDAVGTTSEVLNETRPKSTTTPAVPEAGTAEDAISEIKVVGSGTKLKINNTTAKAFKPSGATVKTSNVVAKGSGTTVVESSEASTSKTAQHTGQAKDKVSTEAPSARDTVVTVQASGSETKDPSTVATESAPSQGQASVSEKESVPIAKARGRFWRRK